jgi:hypothetical protein
VAGRALTVDVAEEPDQYVAFGYPSPTVCIRLPIASEEVFRTDAFVSVHTGNRICNRLPVLREVVDCRAKKDVLHAADCTELWEANPC